MKPSEAFIMTGSGVKLHPFKPDFTKIPPEDIALGLSNECRWGGQLHKFYSVAQHSVLVSLEAESYALLAKFSPRFAGAVGMAGLLHDGPEGLGFRDLPTPVKRFLPEYQAAEQNMLRLLILTYMKTYIRNPEPAGELYKWVSVERHAGIEVSEMVLCNYVHHADVAVLAAERRDLRPDQVVFDNPFDLNSSLTNPIIPLSPSDAREEWLKRYYRLKTEFTL